MYVNWNLSNHSRKCRSAPTAFLTSMGEELSVYLLEGFFVYYSSRALLKNESNMSHHSSIKPQFSQAELIAKANAAGRFT